MADFRGFLGILQGPAWVYGQDLGIFGFHGSIFILAWARWTHIPAQGGIGSRGILGDFGKIPDPCLNSIDHEIYDFLDLGDLASSLRSTRIKRGFLRPNSEP